MNWLSNLQQLPAGAAELAELLETIDQCFLTGFARYDTGHEQMLASIRRIFSGTPLADACQKCGEALQRSEFLAEHFAALAAVRASLQGTYCDVLQKHLLEVLQRPPMQEIRGAETEQSDTPSAAQTLSDSARQWLMEVALTGFAKLDPAAVTPFMPTLHQLQEQPEQIRLSTVLTGFIDEMLPIIPVTDARNVPLARWSDLWTRAVLAAFPVAPVPTETVSGELHLLGSDLHQSPHLVSIVMYGLLLMESGSRVVRITLSSYKVDAIPAEEIWFLFPEAAPLFDALAEKKTLSILAMPLRASGDLLWNGNAEIGKKCQPMKVAEEWFGAEGAQTADPCYLLPADRHPAQLAEPMFLADYQTKKEEERLWLEWGDELRLPVAVERISRLSGLTPENIAKSVQMFGLLRFDAQQWSVQPLGIVSQAGKGKKGKAETIFSGDQAASLFKKPPKTSIIATLQERASRLLRG